MAWLNGFGFAAVCVPAAFGGRSCSRRTPPRAGGCGTTGAFRVCAVAPRAACSFYSGSIECGNSGSGRHSASTRARTTTVCRSVCCRCAARQIVYDTGSGAAAISEANGKAAWGSLCSAVGAIGVSARALAAAGGLSNGTGASHPLTCPAARRLPPEAIDYQTVAARW
jgi:hypothetical protein